MSVQVVNEQGPSRALQIDALKMCPPVGAMYAALGIHGCLPMSHGASGCCRFQRMELAKHFQRIVHVSSSLLKERSAIFGGEANLTEAVANAFAAYDPDIIAIHTTCMSETIGDDLRGIVGNLEIPAGRSVVAASTPGYAGSQLTGYAAMVSAFVEQLAQGDAPAWDGLALLPGWLNPSDIEELVRLAHGFFGEVAVLPDPRGVMDRAPSRDERVYLPGGTPLADIARIASSRALIALGEEAAWPAIDVLDGIVDKRGSSGARAAASASMKLSLPIGIEATDRYLEALAATSGVPVPAAFACERAACVEKVMELHPRLYGKKVALLADADMTLPLAEFFAGIGMQPVYLAVGWADADFAARAVDMLERFDIEGVVNPHADRFDVEEYLEAHPVDLLVGGTRAKMLARRFDIPLVRVGFPVVDRPLSFLDPVVGYRGALCLMREVLRGLAERAEEGLPPEGLSIAETF